MTTVEITKTGTLATTFYKPVGEENMYIHFAYVPLKTIKFVSVIDKRRRKGHQGPFG